MFPNNCIDLNFINNFFCKALFLNPVFPAFQSMVLSDSSDPSTDDFCQEEDLLIASLVESFEADMELDAEEFSDDQSCISFLVPLPVDDIE
jgi:hypothetical protein